MKNFTRFSKASGSTKRRVERIIRLGDRATKRAMRARDRRAFSERLAHENL
jgi:hypothetical protein